MLRAFIMDCCSDYVVEAVVRQ